MDSHYACNSPDHGIARRSFLGGLFAGGAALGSGAFTRPSLARELATQDKRVLCIFLSGGVSQLETWDPKPRTDTGGPFRSIPTSVPGVHFSELLPHTARHMHHMAIVRGINTKEDNHGKGRYLIERGRRQTPAQEFPHLGSVCAKGLGAANGALPRLIRVTSGGSGARSSDSAYLGPRFASISLGSGKPPRHTTRPSGLDQVEFVRRDDLRRDLDDSFLRRRRTAATEAYTYSYEQALRLMERRDVFDVSKEPPMMKEQYGSHDFGRHCLMARRLIEQGIRFVQVSHTNYDTHNENFNFHIEQLGEFDKTFATLLEDLEQRGLLESTLVIVMSEFGRTPRINHQYGRDHWSKAWSIALAGTGIQHGAVIGETNKNGTAVSKREVHHGHLFHTFLQAVGVDSTDHFKIDGRKVPLANPADEPIAELLA